MNWLAFIASLVKSLAWPALIAWAVWFFFKRGVTLTAFIENVRQYFKTVKVGGVELTFQDARLEAEAVAAEVGQPPIAQPPDARIVELSNQSSGLAVIEIWKPLELKIRELMFAAQAKRTTPQVGFVRNLYDAGLISENDLKFYDRLRMIRNEAVHSPIPQSLTLAEIAEFKSWVDTFVVRLEQLKDKLTSASTAYPIS